MPRISIRAFSLTLALLTISCPFVFAQDGVNRIQQQRSDWNWVDNTPTGQAKAQKLIQDAVTSLGKALTEIRRALPVYAGRAHRAQYEAQYALEDLNATLQYQHRSPDGTVVRRQPTADMRDRLKNIPEVKDKNRRDYAGDLVQTSDSQLNHAGLHLLHARDCVIRIHDEFGGHLNDARRLLDMAIDEVRKSVGVIRLANSGKEGFDPRSSVSGG